jgi:hypothetical protein
MAGAATDMVRLSVLAMRLAGTPLLLKNRWNMAWKVDVRCVPTAETNDGNSRGTPYKRQRQTSKSAALYPARH